MPKGDQPAAIAGLVSGVNRGEQYQTLLGATGTGKTFTIANLIAQTGRPALVLPMTMGGFALLPIDPPISRRARASSRPGSYWASSSSARRRSRSLGGWLRTNFTTGERPPRSPARTLRRGPTSNE